MLRAISAKNLDLIPTEEEESTIGETGRLLFSIPRIGLGLMFQMGIILRKENTHERQLLRFSRTGLNLLADNLVDLLDSAERKVLEVLLESV